MTALRCVLADASAKLSAAGIDGAPRDARALVAAALNIAPMKIALEPDRTVNAAEMALVEEYIARRIVREPVSKILGLRAFWGRDFAVTADTLDPRPETEILIAAALEIGPVSDLLDLGTGTGIIPITLLAEWPNARALAADISPECLETARSNAARHGVEARLSCQMSNWFADISGQFPLILSNPPYIALDEMDALSPEVKNHDPHMALTDQGDGLGAYRQIYSNCAAHLTPGGYVMVEIGPNQGQAVSDLAKAAGLELIAIKPDFDDRDRVVIARAPQ